jgi:hypothetical protein
VGPVLGAPFLAQRPNDLVIRETVCEHSAGVIQNYRVGFARRWP